MRFTLALALLLVPALAGAQADTDHAREPEHGRPSEQPRPQPLPQPPPPRAPGSIGSIGLPPISMGVGLSPIGIAIQPVPGVPQNMSGDNRAYAPGRARHPRPPGILPGSGYGYPSAYPITYGTYEATPPPAPQSGITVFEAEPQGGRIRLDVDPPGQWQLFVDGVYYGTADDLGTEVELPVGPRRIELHARGYQPLMFDARITTERAITYRGSMLPNGTAARPNAQSPSVVPPGGPPPAPPAVATGSRTIFVIPGCYLGNVAPQKEKLRDGCDMAGLRTINP